MLQEGISVERRPQSRPAKRRIETYRLNKLWTWGGGGGGSGGGSGDSNCRGEVGNCSLRSVVHSICITSAAPAAAPAAKKLARAEGSPPAAECCLQGAHSDGGRHRSVSVLPAPAEGECVDGLASLTTVVIEARPQRLNVCQPRMRESDCSLHRHE
eukprot:4734553-Pleurochrysis_carterae.AAC.6